MTDAPKTYPRPLSPHLQIYRPQITSVLSILHRATGIVLYFGALGLTWWLFALAASPECFLQMQIFLKSILGQIALFGWTFCMFYHLCNGVRHLLWDAGQGFELSQVYLSGWVVVVGSIALTFVTWVGILTGAQ